MRELKTILDLCGGTGAWSKPYVDAGYNVVVVDPIARIDSCRCIRRDVRIIGVSEYPSIFTLPNVHGILAAPPCTVFSYARNRYPATEEEIMEALSVFDACMRYVVLCKPTWWALENPINKVRKWYGEPRLKFRQWEYGGAAEKPTGIWGDFNIPEKCPVERTKPSTFKTSRENARPEDAITPAGFAKAFFEANP